MAIEYLDETPAPTSTQGNFEYLDENEGQSPSNPYRGPLPGIPSEQQVRNEPGLQDVSIPDAMAVQGAAGLTKGTAGLGMRALGRGVGTVLPENLPETVRRIADNQFLKSTGASMGQINQIGPEAAREAAQVGRQAGLGDVFSTQIGREQALKNLDTTTGKTIGALRQEAGNAPVGLPEKIAQELESKYGTGGVYSGEAGGVQKALADAKRMSGETPLNYPTHASYSKAATFLNDYAAGNKLAQPTNAATDVANLLSRENNAGIVQSLGSDKGQDYLEALKNEQAYKQLEHFFTQGELREMAGRGGGKGLIQQMIQSIADKGGYRLTSKGADALYNALTGPIGMGSAAQTATGNIAKMVPSGLNDFLASKYQNKGETQ